MSLGSDKASGAICTILYINLQTQSISLLLGGVTWHAEHNYHQAQSEALFLPLGVSTDICPHFRHGREHACSLWKYPKLSQWKEFLSGDAGAVLGLLISHWGVQCQICLRQGHVNELKCSGTAISARVYALTCVFQGEENVHSASEREHNPRYKF